MSSEINPPPTQSTFDTGDYPSRSWVEFSLVVFRLLSGLTESGTTAQRPTKYLYVGRRYFDTSLGANGKPIWYSGANWVDATSTIV